MLVLALLAQLIQAPDSARDPVYSTPTLRAFIARAARENRQPPPTLAGYTASLESEMAMVLRDSLGREMVGQVEQLAASAEWDRGGRYDLHVRGYRAQSLGAPYSALSFTRMYSVPTLYGNRLYFGMNDGVPRTRREDEYRRKQVQRDSAARLPAHRLVHPLADDRDRYYRFTGGDTVAVVYSTGRTIRVVRVFAEPVHAPRANFTGFHGELDFDADRFQLVRMRGRLLGVSTAKDPLFVRSTGAVAVGYVEFENAEIGGRAWLPSVQRTEFQAQMAILGETRPIYRIVTRFRDYHLRDTVLADSTASAASAAPMRARLTFATGDSASRFSGWESSLGAVTAAVRADDFDDLAPDVWKRTGAPRGSLWPRKLEDVARYNRVEGFFTGLSGQIRFRDAAPGLAASGSAGWAWTEGTVRGSGALTLARAHWITTARAERTLATTNDFLLALESGLSLGPLVSGVDDHDYVDRRIFALSVSRIFKHVDRAILTSELAFVSDRPEPSRVGEALVWGGAFRPNRAAFAGRYARSATTLEIHPRVTGETLSPGVGVRLLYERAAGELDWQRVELRVASRKYWGGFAIASRFDGGVVLGDSLPPQAMYELGGGQDLPSYGYKEFGGDHAAVGRALASYGFPVLRRPIRVGRWVLPGLSPGIGAGIHGGWAEASSPSARNALLSLGGDGVTPLSRPTGGIRATADVRLMLLSGAIGVGLARPVDHADAWRPFFLWGAAF